ncbi:MAG: hypothetical protein ACI8Y4_001351 [Candidatus Poriferisodalaceae bacterium]|jgi:hypothetical protein
MNTHYVGSGQYCYSNSLAMVMSAASGRQPLDVGLIEVCTAMPFGMFLIEAAHPPIAFTSPLGEMPEGGLDRAVQALGWSCEQSSGGNRAEALVRLREEMDRGPVIVGPVDLGELTYNPQHRALSGGDHYVVPLELEGGDIRLHDPNGFPSALLDIDQFLVSWEGEAMFASSDTTGTPFTLRSRFSEHVTVSPEMAIEEMLPDAAAFLSVDIAEGGVFTNRSAAARLGELAHDGSLHPALVGLLTGFSLPLGARRMSDVARWLPKVGRREAAVVAGVMVNAYGSAQTAAVGRDNAQLANAFEQLAGGFHELTQLLS